MSLRARRGLWHYRFKNDGKEHSGSTALAATPENLPPARAVETMIRSAVAERRKLPQGDLLACDFREAVAGFLKWEGKRHPAPATLKRLRASLSKAREFFKDTPLATIDQAAMDDYEAWRRQKYGTKEATLRHDLQALNMLFKYSFRRRWVRSNPTGKPLFPLIRADPEATVLKTSVGIRRNTPWPANDIKTSEATLRSVSQRPQTGISELPAAAPPLRTGAHAPLRGLFLSRRTHLSRERPRSGSLDALVVSGELRDRHTSRQIYIRSHSCRTHRAECPGPNRAGPSHRHSWLKFRH